MNRSHALTRLAACTIIAIALTACGSEDETTTQDPPTAPATNPPDPAPPAPPANSAPVISGSPAVGGKAGELYSFRPSTTDADNDALSYTVAGMPVWATFSEVTGELRGTPGDADVGQSGDIEITVSDGKASDSIGPFRITIAARSSTPAPTNGPPRISGTPATTVVATTAYTFRPTASDPNSDRLTFAITNRPRWATFSTSTGQLSGTPSRTQTGTYSNIRISVNDGKESASLPAFTITVTAAPNRAPTITGTPSTTAQTGTAYTFQPTGNDPDGDTLTYAIQGMPGWASFSTTTGRLSGTATSAGTFSNIRISVTDSKSAAVSLPAFTITVSGDANEAPTITGNPPSSINVGASYSFTPTADDPDDDPLTFTVQNAPGWTTFNAQNGRLSGSPGSGNVGLFQGITITVSDGSKTDTLGPFSINVTQIATGSATINWVPPTENTDGSTLTNLAGYRIYYGTSANAMNQSVQIANAGLTSYVISNLAAGSWFFSVKSYTSAGSESDASNTATKTIQ